MNLNRIALMIALLFTMLIIVNEKSNALDCVDLYTPQDWSCGQWSSVITTTYIEQTYGCEITVKYKRRECIKQNDPECYFPTQTIVQLDLVSLDWDYDLCTGLTKYIMPGYPDSFVFMNHRFAALMNETLIYLQELEYLDFYNTLTSLEQQHVQCGGTFPDCTGPADPDCQPFMIHYIKSQCISICVNHCPGSGNPISYGIWQCSSDDCCEIKSYFCACVNPSDPTDIIVNRYDIKSFTQSDCSEHTPPPNLCPVGPCWIQQTPCEIYCPDYD